MLKNFWQDQNGAVVSMEIVLIVTVAVLALIVGWSEIAVAANTELNDISNAIGALNQSYCYSGFHSEGDCKIKSSYAGGHYRDRGDDCDFNESCDLVCGSHGGAGESKW